VFGCSRRTRHFGCNLLNLDDARHGTIRNDAPHHIIVHLDVAATAYSSRRVVSGRFPSGYSAYLTDVGSRDKCRPDDKCHGICLRDEECQCICLLNAACVLQMQNVKANFFWTQSVHVNVVLMTCTMASAFWMRSVHVFAF